MVCIYSSHQVNCLLHSRASTKCQSAFNDDDHDGNIKRKEKEKKNVIEMRYLNSIPIENLLYNIALSISSQLAHVYFYYYYYCNKYKGIELNSCFYFFFYIRNR